MSEVTNQQLLDRIENLQEQVNVLTQRCNAGDEFILKILHTIKISEQTFDLRVLRAQYNVFNTVAHNLEHMIDDYTTRLKDSRRNYTVQIVDNHHEANDNTILVIRRADGGYDFSRVDAPEEVNNDGTEELSRYFDEHPELVSTETHTAFNLLVNTPVKEGKVNEQG